MKLAIGNKVPAFEGQIETDATVSNKSLKGQKFVLYFYPKDDTPTCTKQACNLRDHHEVLAAEGITVFGVSPDSVKSHQKFIKKYNLTFSLIADEDQSICNAFGVWGEKTNFGRTYMGVKRTTFVVNGNGIITNIIQKVKAIEHHEQILAEH